MKETSNEGCSNQENDALNDYSNINHFSNLGPSLGDMAANWSSSSNYDPKSIDQKLGALHSWNGGPSKVIALWVQRRTRDADKSSFIG